MVTAIGHPSYRHGCPHDIRVAVGVRRLTTLNLILTHACLTPLHSFFRVGILVLVCLDPGDVFLESTCPLPSDHPADLPLTVF